jgi:hypothetical protein
MNSFDYERKALNLLEASAIGQAHIMALLCLASVIREQGESVKAHISNL